MADAPVNARPSKNWRFPLTLGLAIGLAAPLAWNVAKALESSLPPWAAFALGILAAGAGGAVLALVVSWLVGKRVRA